MIANEFLMLFSKHNINWKTVLMFADDSPLYVYVNVAVVP